MVSTMSLWSLNGPCGYSYSYDDDDDDDDGFKLLKQHKQNETRLKLLKTPPTGATKLKVSNVSVAVLLVMKQQQQQQQQQLIDATDYYQLDGSYLVLKDIPTSKDDESSQQLLQVTMFLVNMTRPLYKCYNLGSGGAKTKDLAFNPINGDESNLITASEYPVDLNNKLFVSTPIENDHQYQLVLRTNLEMINVAKWYIELELLVEEVEEVVEVIGATSSRVEKKDNSTSVLVLLEFDHSKRNRVLWFQDGFGFVLVIKGNQSRIRSSNSSSGGVIKRAIVDHDKQDIVKSTLMDDDNDYHDFIVRVVTLNDFTSEFIHVKIIIVNLDLRKETTLLKQLSFIVDDYAFYECMNNCSGHHQFQNNIVLSPVENNYEFDLWLHRKSSGFYDVFLPTDFIVVYSYQDKEQLSKVVKVYHELAAI